VTVREAVGSRDVPMAHHVALASSPDGRNWRDEYFVSTSTLRGKLLYDDGEQYCYVVGNASVARAEASNRLGYDNSNFKYTVSEAFEFAYNVSGPSSVPEVVIASQNVAGNLSDSGLLEAGNELKVEIGTKGEGWGDLCTMEVLNQGRLRAFAKDRIGVQAMGKMRRLFGMTCYRPAAAKVYDGPYSLYSQFQFDNGEARLTVRQVSGTWVTERRADTGCRALYCRKAGVALVPHSMTQQRLIMRILFEARVSLEGIYFVFWYQDESNYWQAGIYNDSGTHKLQIKQMANGVLSEALGTATLSGVSMETWYGLYLDTRPGRVRVYFNDSASLDFSSPTASASYSIDSNVA